MKPKKQQLDNTTIAYMAVGALIAIVMVLFGISAFLSINSIIIYGANTYTPDEIAAASGKRRGDSLLYLSRDGIASDILSELPYISSVEVSRELPDTLVIEVTESLPVAYIPFSGDALVIDSTGRVLEIMRMTSGARITFDGVSLIEVRGVPISEAVPGIAPILGTGAESNFMAMQDLLAAMERENVAGHVNYLDVANVTNISFGYADMYRVMIGGLRGFAHKISGLSSMIEQVQVSHPNVRGTLNMTDPTGNYRFIVE